MSMPLTAFTADDYALLLRALVDRGYSSVELKAIVPDRAHMFLRHDVDLCPDRALQMARQEAALGVNATYYFLVSTDHYCIAAARNRAILNEIIELGHWVGLHFDADQYPEQADLDAFADLECRILELCSGSPVRSISFHRPLPSMLNRAGTLAGRRHCYEPAFFSDIGYISDSNGGWHHGHPLHHPAVADGRAIQLLTHPIWWTGTKAQSTLETMDLLLRERQDAVQQQLAATVTAYRDALAVRATSATAASDDIAPSK